MPATCRGSQADVYGIDLYRHFPSAPVEASWWESKEVDHVGPLIFLRPQPVPSRNRAIHPPVPKDSGGIGGDGPFGSRCGAGEVGPDHRAAADIGEESFLRLMGCRWPSTL
jgi:hypothetical protein